MLNSYPSHTSTINLSAFSLKSIQNPIISYHFSPSHHHLLSAVLHQPLLVFLSPAIYSQHTFSSTENPNGFPGSKSESLHMFNNTLLLSLSSSCILSHPHGFLTLSPWAHSWLDSTLLPDIYVSSSFTSFRYLVKSNLVNFSKFSVQTLPFYSPFPDVFSLFNTYPHQNIMYFTFLFIVWLPY